MKVAVVTRECASDSRYGMGRSWVPIAGALQARGHVLRRIDGDALDGIAVEEARRMESWLTHLGPSLHHAVASVVARAWAVGTLAARQMVSHGFDAIDCHDFMCAAGLRWQARQLGSAPPRWGYHQHSFNAGWRALNDFYGPLDVRLRRALQRLERRISASANWVIFPAVSAAHQCAADLDLARHMKHWIALRHPVERRVLMARDEARALLGAGPTETVILGIGQFIPLKRFDRLIRALAALPDSCRLWLLGEGDQAALAALARQCDVAERVTMRAVDDVGPWLAAADVYVSTSSTEAFGMANAEAVSAGLPCLIAATGAAPELFSGYARLLVPNLSNLEVELRRAVLDIPARSELAQRTRGFSSALPTADAGAARLEALYTGREEPNAVPASFGDTPC